MRIIDKVKKKSKVATSPENGYGMKSSSNLPFFFTIRNDVNIYTEDCVETKQVYKQILTKVFAKSKIKVNDIYPSGSKSELIKKCLADNKIGGKSTYSFYIVDGDLDIVVGSAKSVPNLIYLNSYCVENILVQENAIVDYLYTLIATKDRSDIKNDLNFSCWITPYVNVLYDFFVHLSIARIHGIPIKKGNIQSFTQKELNNHAPHIDEIEKRIYQIKVDLQKKISDNDYEKLLNEINKKWGNNIHTKMSIICGKDYLLPMIRSKIFTLCTINNRNPGKIDVKSFNLHLAQKIKTSHLKYVKEYVECSVYKNK
jgi:hypothetical protein